jgi:hypothetical protein
MSQSIHRVKQAEVEYNEETRCVSIKFVYDELASESDTNRFAYGKQARQFFGEVTLEHEIDLFLHDTIDPNEFIASLGFRKVELSV